jgi:hypothetical protein
VFPYQSSFVKAYCILVPMNQFLWTTLCSMHSSETLWHLSNNDTGEHPWSQIKSVQYPDNPLHLHTQTSVICCLQSFFKNGIPFARILWLLETFQSSTAINAMKKIYSHDLNLSIFSHYIFFFSLSSQLLWKRRSNRYSIYIYSSCQFKVYK